jgi:uncharacterized protein DUF1571
MDNIELTEPVTEVESAIELPRQRRKHRWLAVFAAVPLLICVLWLVDRWIRPDVPASSGVNIITSAGGDAKLKNSVTDLFNEPRAVGEHPLGQAIEVARAGLEFYRQNVQDYQAVFVKQERVGGRMSNEERSAVKFRRGRVDGENSIPQSIYMRFLEPRSASGREVIYVDGQNDGRLVAHEGGLLNVIRARLEPTSRMAMRGNKHPITEFGIEKLILRLIEKGTRDLQHDDCQVEVNRNIEINGHSGTEIRIVHSQPSEHFDFHVARIIIDDELNLPVGYEGYLWPEKGSTEPVLNERYFYTDLRLNVGFIDRDFDPDNPDYDYPYARAN